MTTPQLITAFESPDDLNTQVDGPLRTTYALAIDPKTGAKKWQFQVNNQVQLQKGFSGPLLTSLSVVPDGIYLYGADRVVYSLDAANGQPRWKLEQSKSVIYRMVAGYKDGMLVFVHDLLQDKWSLRSVTAKDGTQRWEVPIALDKDHYIVGGQASLDNTQAYVFSTKSISDGSTIYSFDLNKGTQLWKYHGTRLYVSPVSTESRYNLFYGQQLVTASILVQSGLAVVNLQNGQELWSNGEDVRAIAVRNTTLYALYGRQLNALDLQTGQVKWTATVSGDLKGGQRLSVANGLLLLNAGNRILGYAGR